MLTRRRPRNNATFFVIPLYARLLAVGPADGFLAGQVLLVHGARGAVAIRARPNSLGGRFLLGDEETATLNVWPERLSRLCVF
jgi:hypothetical protein